MHDEAVAADHRVGEDDGLANPRPGADDHILADADVGTKLEFESRFYIKLLRYWLYWDINGKLLNTN